VGRRGEWTGSLIVSRRVQPAELHKWGRCKVFRFRADGSSLPQQSFGRGWRNRWPMGLISPVFVTAKTWAFRHPAPVNPETLQPYSVPLSTLCVTG